MEGEETHGRIGSAQKRGADLRRPLSVVARRPLGGNERSNKP